MEWDEELNETGILINDKTTERFGIRLQTVSARDSNNPTKDRMKFMERDLRATRSPSCRNIVYGKYHQCALTSPSHFARLPPNRPSRVVHRIQKSSRLVAATTTTKRGVITLVVVGVVPSAIAGTIKWWRRPFCWLLTPWICSLIQHHLIGWPKKAKSQNSSDDIETH